MEKKPRYYTEEFKLQMVKLRQSGKEIPELSRDYGVSKTSIKTWVKQYGNSGKFGVKANESESEKELKSLRKENKQLRMENDILKQAAVLLARRGS